MRTSQTASATLLLTALLALPATAVAQGPPVPSQPHVDAIGKLAFLEGHWEGTGWIEFGGQKMPFDQIENIERQAGGTVLAIEGRGTSQGRVTHHAFAVVTYDPKRQAYTLRSHVMQGFVNDFPFTPRDNGFTWTIDTPQGQMRYTMTLTPDGQWVEIGERSADGQTWEKFLEMTLTKK